jgi:hypothetical protein
MEFSLYTWAFDNFPLTMQKGDGGSHYSVVPPLEGYLGSSEPLHQNVKRDFEKRFPTTHVNTEQDIAREYLVTLVKLGERAGKALDSR